VYDSPFAVRDVRSLFIDRTLCLQRTSGALTEIRGRAFRWIADKSAADRAPDAFGHFSRGMSETRCGGNQQHQLLARIVLSMPVGGRPSKANTEFGFC
jgi:hypothetical protein